jgi:hypothetical protein
VIVVEHLWPFLESIEWLVFLLTHVPIVEMLKARARIERHVRLLGELSLHGALILCCCLFYHV